MSSAADVGSSIHSRSAVRSASRKVSIASGDVSGKLNTGTRVHNIRAAYDLYLDQVGTEKSTLRVDRSACTRICATKLVGGSTQGEVNLRDLDWKLVEYVFGVWGRKRKPSTASRYASTLSKVVEHVRREGWIRTNPVREARKPKVPSHRPDVPNRATWSWRSRSPAPRTSLLTPSFLALRRRVAGSQNCSA